MTRFACALLFFLAVFSASAVELLAPPKIQVGGGVVTITWRTDVPCGTRLSYGPSLTQMDQKIEGPVTAEHLVTLKDLQAGRTYHYTLGSARQKLASGNFTAGPPSMTPASPAAPAPAPAVPTAPKSILDRVREAFTPTAPKPEGATSPSRAPPTRETWGNLSTLQDHFDRHGADFQSRSADDYAAQAWLFLQRARAGQLPMKWDAEDATLRVFDPQTRAFAAYNRDGTTKTYFRPNNPSYWQRQPGRLIQPAELPFR